MMLCFIILNVLVWFGPADGEDLGSDGTTEPVHKRLRLSNEDEEDPQDCTSTEYSVVTLPSEYKHTCTCLYNRYIVTFIQNDNANSQNSERSLLPSMFTHTRNLTWRANKHDSAEIHRNYTVEMEYNTNIRKTEN